jgi:hypothetical protein
MGKDAIVRKIADNLKKRHELHKEIAKIEEENKLLLAQYHASEATDRKEGAEA